MKKSIAFLLCFFSFILLYAEESSASIVRRLLEYGENGQIFLTYEEDKTTIKTIYITAVAPLSNNYKKSRAQQKAGQLAQVYAEQTLIKILNSKVKSSSAVKSTMTDSSAYSSDKTSLSEKISSESSAMIAGLAKVATNPDRDGSYVAVYVWNNTINAGLKDVSKSMKETSKEALSE